MDNALEAKLPTVNTINDLKTPAVAVFGIKKDSPLQLLSLKFSRFPIYQVLEESEFKVEVHEKKLAKYSGDQNLDAVANWLEEATEPVIANIVEQNPGRKLNRALEGQIPLLVIINRDNSDAFKKAFEFLESYCEDKLDFVCGIADKGEG